MKLFDPGADARDALATFTDNLTPEQARAIGEVNNGDPDVAARTMIELTERMLGERISPAAIRSAGDVMRANAAALDRLAAARERGAS